MFTPLSARACGAPRVRWLLQMLAPALHAVPSNDELYPEARRLLDLLGAFAMMPESYLPSQSPARAFCGGAWLPMPR